MVAQTNASVNNNKYYGDVIPVIVLVCNRAEALERLLHKLTKLRSSTTKFPIYVSQDCDHLETKAVASKYDVQFIKHSAPTTEHFNIPTSMMQYKTYYYISRHYKLALEEIFDRYKHESVIILEDDLDIAEDFFSYFDSTYQILKKDESIYCISAWNDNGLPELINLKENAKLYRSDFFPGLGWLMDRRLWKEIGSSWPDGFWDDWIRLPEQRKERVCIRPEVSRTSMTSFGKKGASQGYFFDNFLNKIVHNEVAVDFNKLDLSYLVKETYDKEYLVDVYNKSKKYSLNEVKHFLNRDNVIATDVNKLIRIEYATFQQYQEIVSFLGLMRDFKVGVGRNAYKGILTTYTKNGIRVYIAPDLSIWKGYDKKWEFIP
uniref:Alpha-1,3-mannosyl-glycoprotein 2-beta-N-acetylglucosaminyltransferase n=1 Tax=Rhabditophanes sp. KR3021 TaxID=114890 RepID=A0AC35TNJ2_9BILA